MRLLLSEGFRVFFLAAGVYAVLAMLAWVGWLGVHAAGGMVIWTPFAPAPHLWHAHEMIFGYATAVLGGFFLTAAPSWTGSAPARSNYIAIVAGLWLAGRLALWLSGALAPWLVAVIDLAFLPALGVKIGLNLLRRPKPQNLMLLGVLALIWSGNLLVHLDWSGVIEDGVAPGLRLGLLSIAALISVIGGRVAPAFTRNAMLRSGRETGLPRSHPARDGLGIGASLLLAVSVALGAPSAALAVLALLAGGANALRLAGWRPGWALRQPILWSLHLGFAMLALGQVALGAHWAGAGLGEVAGLHVLGIGAVGGMTLAVMSRAALGHTGRPLEPAPAMVAAYALIALAALTRFVGAEITPSLYNPAMLLSGGLWISGFTLFVAVYAPILTAPRLGRGS